MRTFQTRISGFVILVGAGKVRCAFAGRGVGNTCHAFIPVFIILVGANERIAGTGFDVFRASLARTAGFVKILITLERFRLSGASGVFRTSLACTAGFVKILVTLERFRFSGAGGVFRTRFARTAGFVISFYATGASVCGRTG